MDRLDQLFQQFPRERTDINNVTSKTLAWYDSAWKAFTRARATAPARPASALLISRTDLQSFVVYLRERGVKPVSCNTWLRALNAFCRWLHEQGEIPSLVKLAPQRLEKRIVRTHDEPALRVILTYRPKTFPHWRVHGLVSTILDTGCRIEEVLTARTADFDFDNLLLTVYGMLPAPQDVDLVDPPRRHRIGVTAWASAVPFGIRLFTNHRSSRNWTSTESSGPNKSSADGQADVSRHESYFTDLRPNSARPLVGPERAISIRKTRRRCFDTRGSKTAQTALRMTSVTLHHPRRAPG